MHEDRSTAVVTDPSLAVVMADSGLLRMRSA